LFSKLCNEKSYLSLTSFVLILYYCVQELGPKVHFGPVTVTIRGCIKFFILVPIPILLPDNDFNLFRSFLVFFDSGKIRNPSGFNSFIDNCDRTLVKIFLIIFIWIGTFFRNTQKYSESLHLFSELLIQVNSKIFWNFSSHNF